MVMPMDCKGQAAAILVTTSLALFLSSCNGPSSPPSTKQLDHHPQPSERNRENHDEQQPQGHDEHHPRGHDEHHPRGHQGHQQERGEHPEALRQGGAVQPSEDPIIERWEDEYFPFLGFAAEPATAQRWDSTYAAGQAVRWVKSEDRPHSLDDEVLVPAAQTVLGDDAVPGSRPTRTVVVPSFFIDRYEVSNSRYQAFVKATGRAAPYVHENWAAIYNWGRSTAPDGLEELPVVLVTWDDADRFCRWSGRRLPTEDEWEAAARGSSGQVYPWGGLWDSSRSNVASRLSGPLADMAAWDAFEASWTGSKKAEIAPVGSYPADRSPHGVFDMAGNVSEWVAGTFKTVSGAPPNDRKGLDTDLRVARGNSWGNRDYSAPLSLRYPYRGDRVDSVVGFRCARDAPGEAPPN